jgi:hypothetical protein
VKIALDPPPRLVRRLDHPDAGRLQLRSLCVMRGMSTGVVVADHPRQAYDERG